MLWGFKMNIDRRSGLIALMSGIAVIYPQYANADTGAAASAAALPAPTAVSNG